MRTLPETMIRALNLFRPLFSRRVRQHALVLLVGAILAPGKKRTGAPPRKLSALTVNDDSAATIGF